ncbi:HNH endonuclease [Larkinella sp. VNQ87]|uniref:HNH endonuclease n=1 Tax=Larkinella sp. VNQ87 TaxID=3400921 RepID=UPI003C0753B8
MQRKDLAYYIEAFTTLKQDRASIKKNGFAAPHMPILVLSIIQGFERKLFSDERIYLIPELIDLFTSNWALLVKTGNYHPLIAQPFYHLKSESKIPLWWLLIPNPGCELWLENAGSMRSLRNLTSAVDHAEIDVELSVILNDTNSRQVLRYAVLQKYFPEHINVNLDTAGNHFEEISRQIVNEDPETYIASVKNLKEEMSGSDVQRELFQQEIIIRSGAFKKEVPKLYGYRCCISGLKIDATFNVSMIDACHIVPFAKSYNDTITNGIVLCPNLHRAFDRGMIGVDENFKVIVSERFTESIDSLYSIKQLAGRPILLPTEPRYRPLINNFAWHRKHTFKP